MNTEILKEIQRRGVLPVLGGNGLIEQSPNELLKFTEIIKDLNIGKYLEIGTSTGALLNYMIEFVGLDGWGINLFSPTWKENKVFIGNSHSHEALQFAKQHGPYDLVFIDADHSYQSIYEDYLAYEPLSIKIIAYHDICGLRQCEGSKKFWDELKHTLPTGSCMEIIDQTNPVGIGVVFKENS